MATIQRNIPPSVGQTLQDSCWAAVLESWSRIDPRFNPHLSQRSLIRSYGEGDTGGITPVSKIPIIAGSHNLDWELSEARRLLDYLTRYLPTSHIFCAYTVRQYHHTVLIHTLYDNRDLLASVTLRFMDPDGGVFRGQALDWFLERAPFILMRKR